MTYTTKQTSPETGWTYDPDSQTWVSPQSVRPHKHEAADVVNTYIVCTSTTRPGSASAGTLIYETDTFMWMSWNGTTWNAASPRTTLAFATPSGTTSGTTSLLLGTLSVSAVTYPTVHRVEAQLLVGGWTVAGDEFEFGIYDGTIATGTLMRAIRFKAINIANTGIDKVQQYLIATLVVVTANTTKSYNLYATRLGGTGVVAVTGDSRYSVFYVDIRANG